jgi:hypothetical protein
MRRESPAPVLYRFRWQYQDLEGSAGGSGSARITAGDSLRFDVAGHLGSGRGAAVVVGDSALWAEPEEEVARFAPNYPLLWAMLGVLRLPPAPGRADGSEWTEIRRGEDGRLVAWRFVSGSDTVEIARIAGLPVRLIVDVRQAEGRVGRVETLLGSDGAPRSSRLLVPRAPARLDITYVSTELATGFPPTIWTDRPGRP